MFSKTLVAKGVQGRLQVLAVPDGTDFKLGKILACRMQALVSDLGLASSTWLQLLCMPAGDRHLLHFLLISLTIFILFLCIYLWGPHQCTEAIIPPFTLCLNVLRISEVCSSWLRRPGPRARGPEEGQQPAGHDRRALGRACWLEPPCGWWRSSQDGSWGWDQVLWSQK